MSDLKLFRIGSQIEELEGKSVAIEKSLQGLIEKNLDTFLGIRFLASEYTTGRTHGGRIDTLGIDENNCPVIIEYKRAVNENVINQGLYYLDWLMDHKAEFELLVLKQIGAEISEDIEWSSPRLLCIAGNFTKYDEHAVQQINRNIELIRYKKYADELLLLELVNATTAKANDTETLSKSKGVYKTFREYLAQSDVEVRDRFEAIKDYLLALGDDVQMKELRYYVAFKRFKNFACIQVQPQNRNIIAWLKVNPDTVELQQGFTRDVRSIGHLGTGDLEVTISSMDDFERAKPLLLKSYEGS